MATKCFSLVRGRVMRISRLDGCGQIVLGPKSQVVSDGFITVALTANTDAGTAISVTNAAGNICILDEPCPQFTGYTVEISFCGVDPDLFAMLTGQPVVLDGAGDTVGFRMNSGIDACNSGFALELWSNVPVAACTPGSSATYGYVLVPFLRGGVIGDFTVGNDAVNFTLSGAASRNGSGWGVGPYNVVRNVSNIPSPLLVPVDVKDHLIVQLATVAPPAAVCGAAAVGIPATSGVAGSPGTYLPTNSYGPASFATIGALTASPTTAWTTGQYITLRDGTLAHWSSSAWVAGAA